MSAPRVPDPARPADDPAYSATALAAHWSDHPVDPDRPDRSHGPTVHPAPTADDAVDRPEWPAGPAAQPVGDAVDRPDRPAGPSDRPGWPAGPAGPDGSARAVAASRPPVPARPDRVEGTVLRFGPGVTAAARPRGSAPTVVLPHVPPAPGPAPRRRVRGRRYALPALVFLGVLALLAWQRSGPTVAVHGVAVRTDGVVPAGGATCGGTADVVGVVRTDGRPGTLTYRWLRGDGTASGVLTEHVPDGRHEVRLHLLWTFDGEGAYPARADLEVLSPGRHTAGTAFTYACAAAR
ncbi:MULTISPECIES: hypothetical protein [Streptomyces]|uniref:Uncharacterized protein n=2 Tax=Streptomyces TaxID=1883 RepID=A0A100Y584_9ACTN|nr:MULTISPECIES: hypothetical protein [Streptomyces]KUH37934.1 hypothetical protein ATE80_15460 [Streptomyces kanasensis]UUS29743.1 hypothetical protein NRO40_02105 [Streptomyces changanensis]